MGSDAPLLGERPGIGITPAVDEPSVEQGLTADTPGLPLQRSTESPTPRSRPGLGAPIESVPPTARSFSAPGFPPRPPAMFPAPSLAGLGVSADPPTQPVLQRSIVARPLAAPRLGPVPLEQVGASSPRVPNGPTTAPSPAEVAGSPPSGARIEAGSASETGALRTDAPLVGERPLMELPDESGIAASEPTPPSISEQLRPVTAQRSIEQPGDPSVRPFGAWPWQAGGAPTTASSSSGSLPAPIGSPGLLPASSAVATGSGDGNSRVVRPSSLEPFVELPPLVTGSGGDRASASSATSAATGQLVVAGGAPATVQRSTAPAGGSSGLRPAAPASTAGLGVPLSSGGRPGGGAVAERAADRVIVRAEPLVGPSGAPASAGTAGPAPVQSLQRSMPSSAPSARAGSAPSARPVATAAPEPQPVVQRFFGSLLSDAMGILGGGGNKRQPEPEPPSPGGENNANTSPSTPSTTEKTEKSETAERSEPEAEAELSTDGVRKLAARIYPYISSRLKHELGNDRERAGMITGLHR